VLPTNQRNTQADATSQQEKTFTVTPPTINLPKGGGAIRGIGEKFAANPVTGTGSMTVPIATSPGRSGFGPQLNLSYDSGSGNGPFGFGWSLSLPSITRKTDKGLPRYRDAEESDVFVLSGAEDLVPTLVQSGTQWLREKIPPRTVLGQTYLIQRYRPRIEGQFARIECWTNQKDPTDHFWRSISKGNVTTWYGKTPNSRIFDPADPSRIFSWLICQSYDDKGNAIIYEYQTENSERIFENQQGQLVALVHERNRNDTIRSANRYLKRIKYGNRTPNRDTATWQATDPTQLPKSDWMFEVVFDYGEHHSTVPTPEAEKLSGNKKRQWDCRVDPFSSYRAGFEVRTYRLCQRVLMFHHIPDLSASEKGYDGLVRSTDFTYSYEKDPIDARNPIFSFLLSVTQSGYKRQNTGYLKKSLPPLEFQYTKAIIENEVHEVDTESLENLPIGLDGANYQWMDLDGEGTSGILTEQADGWYYKRNLSANHQVQENGLEQTLAQFGPMEPVGRKPSNRLADGAQFLDLAGDGQVDLVQMNSPVRGFYERTDDANWEPFQAFTSWPDVNTGDPNLKFVDLTGDGHTDILITEGEVLTWYPSLAEEGFGSALRLSLPLDEEKGPRLIFADGTQSIYIADMSGDGLSDIVRIRLGDVSFWPNMGYGHFGAKLTMDNAPWFDSPDQFNQQRIRLADIDGSGTTDIIYLRRDGVQIYFNQSGNSWSKAITVREFPRIDNISLVQVLDLLGNGTACLVWSSPLPSDTGRPMRYIALMEEKPHLLIGVTNNLGAETRVHYASSTKFYLDDKQAGKPWITRLPFPVHVVDRVETYDYISRNRFVTRYAYHHGFFDGIEREFRGFGMVEQWDTEEFAALTANQQFPVETNIDESSHVPPVLTRTWFHTGIYGGRNRVSNFFAGLLNANDQGEYYREPGLTQLQAEQLLLADTLIPNDLIVDEEREACRALKGSMLRQEVYALDGTTKQVNPYSVTEQNFTIERLQPKESSRHAVFLTHARESISYHYERNPADPRVQHALILEVDPYGNVLKEATIGYGRRQGQSPLQGDDKDKQEQILITYIENAVTEAINDPALYPDDYRTSLPCESRTYEITGLSLLTGHNCFTFDEALNAGTNAVSIPYEQKPTAGVLYKRLIEHVRTLYRRNNLTGALPLGELQSMALPFESYKLVFTPGLLTGVYSTRVTSTMLDTDGRYVHNSGDANWWIPSGRMFYSLGPSDTPSTELTYARSHFFLPHRYRDPFHTTSISTETFVTYDPHNLLVEETRDALDNQVTVGERDINPNKPLVRHGQDYRILQPFLIMDPNRNRSVVAFDTLGMVVGTAVTGKPEDNPVLGDRMDSTFRPDLTQAEIDQFFTNPRGPLSGTLLDNSSTRIIYDVDQFRLTREANPSDSTKWLPTYAATLARETHVSDLQVGQKTKIQISFSYSDGFGREIQKKMQAEPGPVPNRDPATGRIITVNGKPVMTPNNVSPRWVGSGWTVFNNKGKPVRQYEPFFTDTHRFEFEVRIGVSPVIFYDPVERVVATLHPNHTWDKVVFDPWQQATWDVNDTVLVTDPKADPDVGDLFSRLQNADYMPTWYTIRQGGGLGAQEQAAARQAVMHAATPSIAHFDSLGRTFLTIAHNKFRQNNTPPTSPLTEEFYRSWVILDIEGNQREIRDERKNNQGKLEERVVMNYDYDMLSNRIHQAGMDAGDRWMLNDVTGKSIYAWDSRRFVRQTSYDALRRPVDLFVTNKSGKKWLAERTVYGESQGIANNHCRQIYQIFDGAGVLTNNRYDFKGNLLRSTRQLVSNYKVSPDWSANPLPRFENETFSGSIRYDALNRTTQVVAPNSDQPNPKRINVTQPNYNEANLIEKIDVWLDQSGEPTGLLTSANTQPSKMGVKNIDYNAKGQRTKIEYKNDATTSYIYDSDTFRLIRLNTTRPGGLNGLTNQLFANATIVQDLNYTYDPVGNITNIIDNALPAIQYNNQNVEPSSDYIYDAVYRLISAEGREHIGQTAFDFAPANGDYRDYPYVGMQVNPNNPKAVRKYTETYDYDEVGNIKSVQHTAVGGSWTRNYDYMETSLLEASKFNNRLTRTTVGNNPSENYSYADAQGNDVHGCMTAINSMLMEWDFKDQLQLVGLIDGGAAYYIYDASGQRIRKVIDNQNNVKQKERIYLGNFEIYREYNPATAAKKLERESLQVMDDKQRIALVETRTDTAALEQLIRYQLSNHLDSANLELDSQSQIISYEEYYPYGISSYQAVRSQTETPKQYRYTGKERDEESGLYYHGARYYMPWLGRWTSSDPMQSLGGESLYTYVRNNPIRFIDPDGHRPVTPGEAAKLERLENLENYELARHASTAPWVQSYNKLFNSGPLRGAEIARLNRTRLAEAIERAGKGESVVLTYSTVSSPRYYRDSTGRYLTELPSDPIYKTGGEAYWERQQAVGSALAFSPLSGLLYVAGALFGARQETKENLALGGASLWEAAVAAGALAEHRQANKSLSNYQFGPPLYTGGANGLTQAESQLIWSLRPDVRGKVIEDVLAKTDYSTWEHVGEYNNGFFPAIDFAKDSTVVSVKTVNPNIKTFFSALEDISVNLQELSVAEFPSLGPNVSRVLDVRVPREVPESFINNLQEHLESTIPKGAVQIKVQKF